MHGPHGSLSSRRLAELPERDQGSAVSAPGVRGGIAVGQGYSHKSPEAALWGQPCCPRTSRPLTRGAFAHWSSVACDPDANMTAGTS